MAKAPSARFQVFICHAAEDKSFARDLYKRLRSDGLQPWLDEEALLPGADWEFEIQRAVRESAAVLVLLSARSVTKQGYLQRELRKVLEVADEQPEGAIFLIPVRLDECDVPLKLQKVQWVNYTDEGSYERLLRALRSRSTALSTQFSPSADWPQKREAPRPPVSQAVEPPRPYAFERLGGGLAAACLHEDGRHAWAGGENGRVLRSEDAGHTWERVLVDRRQPIVLAIRFPSGVDHGWALALDGVSSAIYTTSNGGRDWRRAAHFDRLIIGDFLMQPNGRRGWAFVVGGNSLVTSDGWLSSHPVPESFLPELWREFSSRTGAAVGDHGEFVGPSGRHTGFDLDDWLTIHGRLVRRVAVFGERAVALTTQDRRFEVCVWNGERWDTLRVPGRVLQEASRLSGPLFDVALGPGSQFIHVLLTNGILMQSADGGATWTVRRSARELRLSALAVQSGGSSAMLVGDGERILFSTDNGATWRRAHDPLDGYESDLHRVSMDSSGRNVWITGRGGRFLRTENFGCTWKQSTPGDFHHIVLLPDGQNGWACPYGGGLLRTRDSGRNWTQCGLPLDDYRQAVISQLVFDASGKRGWAAAMHDGGFFYTDDSGDHWHMGRPQIREGSREEFPFVAWQPAWDRVWFTGTDLAPDGRSLVGCTCHSVFPYTEFQRVTIPIGYLYKLWFSSDGQIGFALSNTEVAKSIDGGETWKACPLPEPFEMTHGFWFDREGRNGWVYGRFKNPNDNNDLLRTADGGHTWFAARVDKRNLVEYLGLAFSEDFSSGWLAGVSGFLYCASLADRAPVIHQFAVSETGALDLRVEGGEIEADEIIADITVSGPGLDFVQDKVHRRFRLSEAGKVPRWSPTMFLPGQCYRFQLCVSNGWNVASHEFVLGPR